MSKLTYKNSKKSEEYDDCYNNDDMKSESHYLRRLNLMENLTVNPLNELD